MSATSNRCSGMGCAMPSATERYLQDLAEALRWRPVLARRILPEVADHLAEAAATHRRAGLPVATAEETAVREFGPATQLAAEYRRARLSLGLLLAAGAGTTALIALWLLFVTTFILTTQDPANVSTWRVIAGLFGGYSILSVLLLEAPRRRLRRWLTGGSSVLAIAFGGFAIAASSSTGSDGRHGEGYLLLMGALLAAHGLVGLTFALLSARIPSTKSGTP
jgi:HAAS